MADASTPAVKLLARGPNGIVGYTHENGELVQCTGCLKRLAGSATALSSDGRLLAVLDGDEVVVYDTTSEQEVSRITSGNTVAIAFSPRATYLITLSRPDKAEGNAAKNLKAWDVATGGIAVQLHQKSTTKEQAPYLHFTADESMVYHLMTNAVNGYDMGNVGGGVAKKLYLKGVANFMMSPGGGVIVAYVPEIKSAPASVALYDSASLPQGGTETPQALARRNFFRSSSATFCWSPAGTAVVVTAISDVDASNKSYYGEQKLHFLSADGQIEQAVPLQKEGPVHDVQWDPSGKFFVCVHGFMPAKVLLFDAKCKPVYDMGSGPYGMAAWNPQGRFLALGGFGNLSGDLMFLDKKADSKCKPIANVKARDTVSAQWSPCGRYFLTATTSPRLRVDNGLKVFKYDGTLVQEMKMDVLLDARWIPAPAGVFPDRPQSPRKEGASAAQKPSSLAPVPQASGYVPPHLRGASGGQAPGGTFSLAFDSNDKMRRPGAQKGSALPPGAAPPDSKTASKNAKRRANRKKTLDSDNGSTQGDQDGSAASVDAAATGVADLAVSDAAVSSDPSKKIKNLKKKLAQIQQLKDKRDAEGASSMDPDQLKKIATEDEVRKAILVLEG